MRSKHILAALLCGAVCFGLCACSESTGTVSNEPSDINSTDVQSEQGNIESGGEISEGGETSDASVQESGAEESGGAANADKEQYTDPYSPAPLGEWVKSMVHNYESDEQEVIYWRILSVDPDGQPSVDAYNDGGNFWILEQPEEDFIKYYAVDYEIKYPEDYTESDTGIRVSSLTLYAEKPNGGGFEKDGTLYLGVGSTTDVTEDTLGKSEEDIHPGDVVKQRSVYPMIDGETDYVFRLEYKDADGEYVRSYAASK